ncbi:MAG: hypothetical protein HYZ74_06870, partial [Elusimicrobia bacterium]|nr:hypothetical protein [Elusimicrobiota bacterium]
MKLLVAVFLLAAAPTRAEDGEPASVPEGKAVEGDRTEAVAGMRRQLEGDPSLQEALVERIMRSQIADAISKETDDAKKAADVREWMRGDLGSAAEIALGLNKDDADGTHRFENTLVRQMVQTYARNPNANKGAYGVLKDAAKKSKIIDKAEQDVGEEQRREMLRNLFDGNGAQGERVITGKAPDGKEVKERAPAATLASSFYDRLSAGNIRGYSPQLLAMQNALNARRPPEAPRLIETGKLDYATLAYPAYGLRYDIGNLEERLRRERVLQLASLAGVGLTASDAQDPGLEARLLAKVPADKIPQRLAARKAVLGKAKAALAAFEEAAARGKDPGGISKALLVELGARQREASRWITVAALEEELSRVETDAGFLTAELLAAIAAVPAPAPLRESYQRRGAQYQGRLALLQTNARAALGALTSDAWLARISDIEKAIAKNQSLRRNLSRDISDYRLIPYRIAESTVRQARWRALLDDLA